MPVWRLQTSWAITSTFPRDRMVITPHFNDGGALTDPQGLCDDLAAAVDAWFPTTGELKVSAYDAQGTVPVFPQGETILRPGTAHTASSPRELALCLSFYSQRNLPRQRGRIYVPAFMAAGGGVGLRPTATTQQKLGALADVFGALGGPDVDWSVYSRTTQTAHPVTNWWVDDEWDVMRSRGLRGENRLEGTTEED